MDRLQGLTAAQDILAKENAMRQQALQFAIQKRQQDENQALQAQQMEAQRQAQIVNQQAQQEAQAYQMQRQQAEDIRRATADRQAQEYHQKYVVPKAEAELAQMQSKQQKPTVINEADNVVNTLAGMYDVPVYTEEQKRGNFAEADRRGMKWVKPPEATGWTMIPKELSINDALIGKNPKAEKPLKPLVANIYSSTTEGKAFADTILETAGSMELLESPAMEEDTKGKVTYTEEAKELIRKYNILARKKENRGLEHEDILRMISGAKSTASYDEGLLKYIKSLPDSDPRKTKALSKLTPTANVSK